MNYASNLPMSSRNYRSEKKGICASWDKKQTWWRKQQKASRIKCSFHRKTLLLAYMYNLPCPHALSYKLLLFISLNQFFFFNLFLIVKSLLTTYPIALFEDPSAMLSRIFLNKNRRDLVWLMYFCHLS